MNKLFALTVILTLAFTTCEQSAGNNPGQTTTMQNLTIRNESSYVLTNVKFSGVPFEAPGSNDLPVSNQSVKGVAENVANQAGYITFTRKDIGIDLRTSVPISFPDQNYIFVFTDNTVVQEQANTGNQGTLSTISFLSKAAVERGGLPVAKNDTVRLGESVVTYTKSSDFSIKNAGSGKLLFSVNEPIKIDGEAGIFSVTQPTSREIAANTSLPFKINFTPREEKTYYATVTISSNDRDGDFIFFITGQGVPPKPIATVFCNDNEIEQDGTIDAGTVLITLSNPIQVTIKNEGTLPLTIDTPNITITGADESAFIKLTNPGSNISAGGQSSFIIECKPEKVGGHNAVMTIPTNDNDRNPIVIYLTLTGEKGEAIPELRQGTAPPIGSNSITPFDFDKVDLGTNKPLTFTLKNIGNIALELSGDPLVESSNPVFEITTQPAASVIDREGGTTFFVVTYTPEVENEDFGKITFRYNEGAEFILNVKGTGHVKRPEITMQQGNITINQHEEYDFDTIAVGKTKDITFTIGNSGDADLTFVTVDGSRINLADNTADSFTVIQQPSASAVVTPKNTTVFVIRFSPESVGGGFSATVRITTNSRNNDEFSFRIKGAARAANTEARLSGIQLTSGTLDPQFNANIYSYDLRIQEEATLVNIRPTSMDPNITGIKVNGVSQASGVNSQDIILASNNTVTIEVTAENGTTTATYTLNIVIVKTWEKLYGQAGRRYGVVRTINNGSGGVYAGGYTSDTTAALFNFDGNGNLQNTFPYSSNDGTLGPLALGMEYNDFYSVYATYDLFDYYITKTTSPALSPSIIRSSELIYNDHYVQMYPQGIVKKDGYYYVAGQSGYAATTSSTVYSVGTFIARHYSDGTWEKGRVIIISQTGIRANTFAARGMTLLSNGDVLLYGEAETTAGRKVAFASAINVSNANATSWAVRWTQTYEITNKASRFYHHFVDNSSNIILLGESDDGGLVVKFPLSATTAAAAKPAGWPKTIVETGAGFISGLAVSDGSGYLFVGGITGPHGGQDIWVVKTDTNVTKTWEKFYGGSGHDIANAIIEQPDSFIIAGSTFSPIIAGQARKGTEDIYILKINKDGTMD